MAVETTISVNNEAVDVTIVDIKISGTLINLIYIDSNDGNLKVIKKKRELNNSNLTILSIIP